jgi:hypothetical protein
MPRRHVTTPRRPRGPAPPRRNLLLAGVLLGSERLTPKPTSGQLEPDIGRSLLDAPAICEGIDHLQTHAALCWFDSLADRDTAPASVLHTAKNRSILGHREIDVDWPARAMLDAVRYEFTHDRQDSAPASSRKARANLSSDGLAGTARRIERRCQLQVEISLHVPPPIVPFLLVPRHPKSQSRRHTRSAPNPRSLADQHFGREAATRDRTDPTPQTPGVGRKTI